MPKILRLNPDDARLLASWLRMAAAKMDRDAEHLRGCGHSFVAAAEATAGNAARARRLADRLSA